MKAARTRAFRLRGVCVSKFCGRREGREGHWVERMLTTEQFHRKLDQARAEA